MSFFRDAESPAVQLIPSAVLTTMLSQGKLNSGETKT